MRNILILAQSDMTETCEILMRLDSAEQAAYAMELHQTILVYEYIRV